MWAPMDFALRLAALLRPVVYYRSTGSTGSVLVPLTAIYIAQIALVLNVPMAALIRLYPWYHQCSTYTKYPERTEYSKCPRAGAPSAAAEQLESAHRILSTLRGPADPWVSRLAKQLEAVRPVPPTCNVQCATCDHQ